MAKPWDRKPLWEPLYLSDDRVHLRAAVIIGHLGVTPFDFYDKAKKLPGYVEHKYRRAVEDMTVYNLRESPSPRYELTAMAKKAARILLGPPPDSPEYASWWRARLVSVEQMREAGTPINWAEEPPVPLDNLPPPKITDEQMAAVMREWADRTLLSRLREELKKQKQHGRNPVVGEEINRKVRLMQAEAQRRGLELEKKKPTKQAKRKKAG